MADPEDFMDGTKICRIDEALAQLCWPESVPA